MANRLTWDLTHRTRWPRALAAVPRCHTSMRVNSQNDCLRRLIILYS